MPSVPVGEPVAIPAVDPERHQPTDRGRTGGPKPVPRLGYAADERIAQIARIGDRSYVVVGDSTDRAGAEALAKRLRAILNQDVAVIRM